MTSLFKTTTNRHIIFVILCASVLLKCILAHIVPIMGDEAYYVYWGRHVYGGYYDHPPMIGWWEALFSPLSNASWWLRMPMILTMLSIAVATGVWLSQFRDKKIAYLIAGIWFFSPLYFMEVFVITDVPLLAFTFFASLLFFKATESSTATHGHQAKILFLCAGILWGCAFLSKYFAVFMIPAYGWYLYVDCKERRVWPILFFILGAAPFCLQHLYWNYTHCWETLYFQIHQHDSASEPYKPFTYLGLFLIYLSVYITPIWWRDLFFAYTAKKKRSPIHRYSFLMWFIPCLGFAITTVLGKAQGLHWYFFIFPYFYIWIGLGLSASVLKRRFIQMISLTGVIYIATILFLAFPPQVFTHYLIQRYGYSAQLSINPQGVIKQIKPELQGMDAVLLINYATSSVFELELMRDTGKPLSTLPIIGVFNNRSRFGHVPDSIIDFNQLAGKNILFILKNPMDLKAYFNTVEEKTLTIYHPDQTTPVYIIKGFGFHAKPYMTEIVKPIINQYYWSTCRLESMNALDNKD